MSWEDEEGFSLLVSFFACGFLSLWDGNDRDDRQPRRFADVDGGDCKAVGGRCEYMHSTKQCRSTCKVQRGQQRAV